MPRPARWQHCREVAIARHEYQLFSPVSEPGYERCALLGMACLVTELPPPDGGPGLVVLSLRLLLWQQSLDYQFQLIYPLVDSRQGAKDLGLVRDGSLKAAERISQFAKALGQLPGVVSLAVINTLQPLCL